MSDPTDSPPSGGPPRTVHDSFFKQVFGDPALAAEELQAVLPAEVTARIDWATLKPAPANFVDAVFRQRSGDLVFHARLVGGGEVLLWFLLEHQSSQSRWMPLRMVNMQDTMWQSWRVLYPESDTVPAIVPVVVYHGDRPWQGPCELSQLYGVAEPAGAALGDHVMRSRFVLDDLSLVEEEALRARRMDAWGRLALFAMMHGAAEDFLERLAARWGGELKLVLAAANPERGTAFLLYTVHVNRFADLEAIQRIVEPAVGSTIEEVIVTTAQTLIQQGFEKGLQKGLEKGREQGLEKGLEKGLEQGLEKGREQERRELLLHQLEWRFGPLPPHIVLRVAAASSEEHLRWARQLLTASSLDALFAGSQ